MHIVYKTHYVFFIAFGMVVINNGDPAIFITVMDNTIKIRIF